MDESAVLQIGKELGDLNRRVTSLEAYVDLATYYGRRVMLLIGLWTAALTGYSSSQAAGEMLAGFIKGWIGQ